VAYGSASGGAIEAADTWTPAVFLPTARPFVTKIPVEAGRSARHAVRALALYAVDAAGIELKNPVYERRPQVALRREVSHVAHQ